MYTQQEIYDKSIQTFLIDKAPPGYINGSCVYYDPFTGLKCIVGNLLTQDSLNSITTMEVDIGELIAEYEFSLVKKDRKLLMKHHNFLDALQAAHDRAACDDASQDNSDFRRYLKEGLESIATMYKLDTTLLATI